MDAFRCGHPLTPENSKPTGKKPYRSVQCRFCSRVRTIVLKVEREQAHINAGRLPNGQTMKWWQ